MIVIVMAVIRIVVFRIKRKYINGVSDTLNKD